MAENRRLPLMIIITKPAIVHGIKRRAASDTGTLRIIQPSRRRSNITARPKNRHRAHTWTDSRIGYPYRDSCRPTLHEESAIHLKKARRDIGTLYLFGL